MSLIPYPNVPNVPGVPDLLRNATVPSGDALLQAAESYLTAGIFGEAVWGIYDQSGTSPVLVPDVFLSIDYRNGCRVATHPVEDGGFESYNKVNTPYDCQVRVVISGDIYSRQAFLSQCESMLKSTDMYSVVTPEKIYLNATLQNYSYRRESRSGVSLVTVDLWFLEVRERAVLYDTYDPAQPSGYSIQSGGQVQAGSLGIYNPATGQDMGEVQ